MKYFHNGDRIVVTEKGHLLGKHGTVVRLLIRSQEAWVRMDENLPDDLASFPEDDARHNHVLLWPDQCEKETK